MITHAAADAPAIDVLLSADEFIEGSAIDAEVRGVAGRGFTTTGGELALIKTVTFNRAPGTSFGGSFTVPARGAEVITWRALRAGRRDADGEPWCEAVSLAVPAHGPGSATTAVIRIDWSVRAHLQLEGQPDLDATRDIVVLSRAADRASVEQGAPVVQDRQCALLAFEDLSSRRLTPGVPLTGILTVSPRRRVSTRALRLELVLRQQIHDGRWIEDAWVPGPVDRNTGVDTVVATARLTEKARLDPARPPRFPFSVPVPDRLPAPSIRTPRFTISWILRGVLDRALHQDPTVELELRGMTTAD